jgi:deazaflavin-dependent oxidoreductase (nitroreductase family)
VVPELSAVMVAQRSGGSRACGGAIAKARRPVAFPAGIARRVFGRRCQLHDLLLLVTFISMDRVNTPGDPGSRGSLPARFLFRRPLPYVDPHARQGVVRRGLAAAGSGALPRWLSTTRIWRLTVWRAEPHLQRLSGGRLTTAAGLPTALLETRGARTGQWRKNGVIYFHDGDQVTIIASQAGYPGNPGWYYNLLAHPDVMLGGERFRARVVTDAAERRRLWDLADRVFPAFAEYRRSAAGHGREIPVIQLTAS